ncbi:cysteine proteinase [Striga asiatica]|uniref:Cysteine proteinase n=1 Tax=Striga asiatica TaxID=4170 RepID=A0A5A7QBD7_STRAF|nr:cysteine proteinase [Striga asiatica]
MEHLSPGETGVRDGTMAVHERLGGLSRPFTSGFPLHFVGCDGWQHTCRASVSVISAAGDVIAVEGVEVLVVGVRRADELPRGQIDVVSPGVRGVLLKYEMGELGGDKNLYPKFLVRIWLGVPALPGDLRREPYQGAEHQAMDPTAVHGITQFSNLSKEELEVTYLGVKGGTGIGRLENVAAEMEVRDLPEIFE